MKTEVIRIEEITYTERRHSNNADHASGKDEMKQQLKQQLKHAAEVLKNGGIVAFPTETVYGLGANALDEEAVHKIFKAKGRPSDNPFIVHIAMDSEDKLDPYNSLLKYDLVEEIPEKAKRLIEEFWPGPLTIIMKKKNIIPDCVTAGLDTVGIRMPSHPVALELIRQSGVPVAAPSANISGKPSTTSFEHVMDDMYGKVDVIIDGGSSKVGLESTVIDVTGEHAVILRPGGITAEQIKSVLGTVEIDGAVLKALSQNEVPRAPGMKYTHYAPNAEVIVVEGNTENIVKKISVLASECTSKGKRVGILATDQTRYRYSDGIIISAGNRDNPSTIAENLFSTLRDFDRQEADIIFAEGISFEGIGFAVMNRMKKAAGYRVIMAE